jgi:DNA mismatch repair protein MutL
VEITLSRIKILSEHLANQIAAGEVIERPASVVKELLENSIDAGASQVQIEIEGSGTRLIKAIDNGMGMDEDDALLCLERHATSKLGGSTNDGNSLNAIRSLGFRGEAIPSIASVSKMTITSRTENNPLGSRLEVRYGTAAIKVLSLKSRIFLVTCRYEKNSLKAPEPNSFILKK